MGRREENKARKRAALEQAGLELFEAQGFHRASVEQIASAAGVARGTFYLYFDDKEALFVVLVRRVLDPVLGALQACSAVVDEADDAHEVLRAYLTLSVALSDAVMRHTREALLYYREQRDPSSVGQWLRSWTSAMEGEVVGMVQVAMARGWMRQGSAKVVGLATVGAIDRLVYTYLSGQELGGPLEVGLEVSRLFGEGVLAPGVTYMDLVEVRAIRDAHTDSGEA